MRYSMLAAWAAMATGAISTAHAEQIRFTFTGTLTARTGALTPPTGVQVGAAYSYSYIIDAQAVDLDPAPNLGLYPAVKEASVQVGPFSRTDGPGLVTALNNGIAGDTYTAMSNHPIGFAQVSLTDLQGAAFATDALPTDLTLAQFESRVFTIHGDVGPAFWELTGTILTFSREVLPACDPDFNADGNVDQSDIAYLIDVLAGGPNPEGRDPDFNGDGNADQSDAELLIAVVAGQPCP